jgi:hypothetical protein
LELALLTLGGTFMAWEVFTKKIIRTGDPVITLGKMGRMAFNMQATNIFEAHNATHVVLLWDKEAYKCGVRLASNKDVGAYKLTFNKKYNGAGFSAVTFMNHIRYDWTETRAFNADWDEAAQMFVFAIPQEHFGTAGNLSQALGKLKRSDRLKPKDQVATEVTT